MMTLDKTIYNVKPVYVPINYGPFYYYPNWPAVIVGWGSTSPGRLSTNSQLKNPTLNSSLKKIISNYI